MAKFRPLFLPLWACLCFAAWSAAWSAAGVQPLPQAIASDPPRDRVHPAAMVALLIPSHGVHLNAFMYLAEGAGAHPVVILLHGFPGNERNLDLAQAIRRAGWNVLYFDYRGSWGTPGTFSFTHSLEDTETVADFLADPSNAAQLRTDPKRIVLIGHSLGGFFAAYTAAHNPAILGVGLISAENLGGISAAQGGGPAAVGRLSASFTREGMEPLSGCTAESLARETVSHRGEWNFDSYAPALAGRPVLIVTSDEGLAGQGHALAYALLRQGSRQVTEQHFASDHSYSSVRIGLETTVLNWLAAIPIRGAR